MFKWPPAIRTNLHAMQPASSSNALPKRKRAPDTCWGQLLGGGSHAPAEPTSAAFRQRFCSTCRRDGLLVPASRVRIVDSSLTPCNTHSGGVYNTPHGGNAWPAHRLINHTQNCVGPRLVVLREETADVPGLSPVPCAPGSLIAFRVGRTLQPSPLPQSMAAASGPHIRLPTPPLLPQPPLLPPPRPPSPQEPPPLQRASSSEPSSSMSDGLIGGLEGTESIARSSSSAPTRGDALSQLSGK